jgi:putative membrane protein insertion efficiency factor
LPIRIEEEGSRHIDLRRKRIKDCKVDVPLRALFWTVIVSFITTVYPLVLGANEETRAERAQRGAWVVLDPSRQNPEGGTSPLDRWSRVARGSREKTTHPIRLTTYAWIRIFQRFISPVDGSSCTYYPTCSAYGLHAIEKHGLLIGIPMTTERIMRDHHPNNAARYPLHEYQGQFYYLDPVESNDDWWASGP